MIQFESSKAENLEFSFDSIDFNSFKKQSESSNQFFQIYNQEKKPIYWNRESVSLPKEVLRELDSNLKYYKFGEKSYLLKSYDADSNQIVHWFQIDQYISQHLNSKFRFFKSDNERKEYQILKYSQAGSHDIKDKHGNYLFSIAKTNYSNDIWILFSIIFICISIVSLFKGIYYFCKRLTRVYPIFGSILFIGIIIFLRKVCLFYKFPGIFYTLKLFNPALYHSDVTPSLGDLFLFIVSFQISISFLKSHFRYSLAELILPKLIFIVHTFALIFLLGEAFSVNKIFDRMVVESSIWFNFNYFPRLTIYSFIGLAIMLLSFTNYYLLSNFIVRKIVEMNLSKSRIIYSFAIVIIIIISGFIFTDYRLEIKASLCFLCILLIVTYSKYRFNFRSRLFNNILFLIFATSFTTYLLYQYNIRKENAIMSSISSNLAFGKDKNIEQKIIQKLKSETFFHHDENSLFFIQEIDALDYQNSLKLVNENLDPKDIIISDTHLKLFLINSENDNHYIAERTTQNTKRFLRIYPKNLLNHVSFSTKKAINDIIIRDHNINYAIYINDILQENSGLFPYSQSYNFPKNKHKFFQYEFNTNFEHSIFKYGDEICVVVSTIEADTVSILTQFSYIFCFNIILLFIFKILSYFMNIDKKNKIELLKLDNLRTKIVIAILLIIASIFISIGYLSYGSLKTKFNENNRDVLLNNLNITQLALSNILEYDDTNLASALTYVDKLAKNLTRIDIYDENGMMINQKNQESNLLDPSLFARLKKTDSKLLEIKNENQIYEQYEAISTIVSKSNKKFYILLKTEGNKSMLKDLSKLIVSLLNLYVLLFLIAMAFAFWLANQITKPLQLLAEKISNIKLSKRNEYLEYKYNDEIGELVKKYNQLIDELDNSAKALAFHEREEAWSAMAKQIAHEIKNPLTPMKLKIQYLQRKIKDNAPDAIEFASDTSNTLIEQINNLDNIATSFSNFAKLHNPKIEILDWIKLIKNVANMFDTPTMQIEFHSDVEMAIIACDQNQMISCLNNIIKNATQAYDEEKGKINIKLTELENKYVLQIEDYGKGIMTEDKNKIFTPNFTTKSSGTGLGLAITKKIIEAFEGSIDFKSQLGIGSTFFISIPKHTDKQQS